MDPFDEFLDIFADDLVDGARSQEIYAALCNNTWQKNSDSLQLTWRAAAAFVAELRNALDLPREDPLVCQRCGQIQDDHIRKNDKNFFTEILDIDMTLPIFYCGEDEEETFLPGRSGQEDYLDFYCSGGEGRVAEWIDQKLERSSWHLL